MKNGNQIMESEKCAYCGDLTDMPFHCNYCKDPFCAEHRLPEEHRCVKLAQIRAKRFGEKKVIRDGGRNKSNIFKRIFKR
jgi:predicted nucleic acid binding AN1-type Zn finger protein